MPNLLDVLADYVARVLLRAEVPPQARATFAAADRLFTTVGLILAQIAAAPADPGGYRDRLVEHGSGSLGAQGLAKLVVHIGKRRVIDTARRPQAVKAIRFFAKSNRQGAAVVRNAKIILVAWRETSVIETLFADAGRSEFEVIRLVERAAAGDLTTRERLRQIAIDLRPVLKLRRGRRISVASEAHQILLGQLKDLGTGAAYTWNEIEDDFTDVWTKATRVEFQKAGFDPRPSYRRYQAQN